MRFGVRRRQSNLESGNFPKEGWAEKFCSSIINWASEQNHTIFRATWAIFKSFYTSKWQQPPDWLRIFILSSLG